MDGISTSNDVAQLEGATTPEHFLTYPGDRRPMIGNGHRLGPGLDGRWWLPTYADYNFQADRTSVGVIEVDSKLVAA